MRLVSRTALLSTLAGAKRLRRGVALLACMAIISWTLLSATHSHDHDDAGTRGHATADCVLCLGMPTGATPPQYSIFRALQLQAGATLLPESPVALVAGAPSAYLSRGPPVL